MVEVIHFINTFKCIINIHAKCLSKMNMSAYIHGYQTCSLLIWILSSFGIKKKKTLSFVKANSIELLKCTIID